jgi:RNA polymerase sigma-70 factor (ECF subfamily)
VLDELNGCLPSHDEKYEDGELIRQVINSFLRSLPKEKRRIFVRRYWYMSPISEIAKEFAMSEGKVKMILMRLRKELKKALEREGVTV